MWIATGEDTEDAPDDGKDKAAQALGRKGGQARVKALGEIARVAAKTRWSG